MEKKMPFACIFCYFSILAIYVVQSSNNDNAHIEISDSPHEFFVDTATQVEGAAFGDGRGLSNSDAYSQINVQSSNNEIVNIKRSDFPHEFFFGTATSSYQVEGAAFEDGRGLSNWDAFSQINGSIDDGTNAYTADDHYHRYMEDIEIMHSLGVNAYRFSISWSRLLPRGRFGEVNQAAIDFYNKIIDNVLSRGIEPFVTIFHFEYPQELEDRYGAWLSPLMQDDFVHFAKTCFENFADRVKYWITINEPNLIAEIAYLRGIYPPRRCSPPFGNCTSGNSDVEPLIVVHNELLAHAKAVKLYREQYKHKEDGAIGMVEHAFMFQPFTYNKEDKEAVNRALAFNFGWVLDPVVLGDYPTEMKQCLGRQLPRFSSEEKALLRNSVDFIGINHYGSLYAKDCIHSIGPCMCNEGSCSVGADHPIKGFMYTTAFRNGVSIGEPTGLDWFFVVPRGLGDVMDYVKDRYHNTPMFVTENGYVPPVNEDDKNDVKRIYYHKAYLTYLAEAIRKGADVRGYFVWSLMDNFEWTSGYSKKFGLYHIDPETLNRIPKHSANWYRDFLSNSSHADTSQSWNFI